MTPDRYHVHLDGPLTSVTEHPDAPWARWEAARLAAIEHLESQVRECQRTVECLRRAGSFFEYTLFCNEMGAVEPLSEVGRISSADRCRKAPTSDFQ